MQNNTPTYRAYFSCLRVTKALLWRKTISNCASSWDGVQRIGVAKPQSIALYMELTCPSLRNIYMIWYLISRHDMQYTLKMWKLYHYIWHYTECSTCENWHQDCHITEQILHSLQGCYNNAFLTYNIYFLVAHIVGVLQSCKDFGVKTLILLHNNVSRVVVALNMVCCTSYIESYIPVWTK